MSPLAYLYRRNTYIDEMASLYWEPFILRALLTSEATIEVELQYFNNHSCNYLLSYLQLFPNGWQMKCDISLNLYGFGFVFNEETCYHIEGLDLQKHDINGG